MTSVTSSDERSISGSRLDQFGARLPSLLHSAFSAQADQSDRSLNSELKHAIDQWAADDSKTKIFHRMLSATSVDVTVANITSDGDLEVKYMCRLAPGQREILKQYSKAHGIPMNKVLLVVMVWWININAEIDAMRSLWAAHHLHQAD